ncbi:MAG TPA: nicotinamide riboside transporter PnuC [Candidatus Saccharimonas sp.]|jgi:nicotinamide mononucleotide transporter|nr:nicotinamide riboside transporter PnuC [Candidatus Saccharimonas sp.]
MKKLLTTTRVSVRRDVLESALVGVILTLLSYVIGIMLHWVSVLNWLEVFAVFTSYMSTYLCVKERRANYPLGAISTAAYAILFLQSGLLSSAMLNLYLTPTLIYGWIRWRKDAATRPVTHVELRWVPIYLLVAGLGYAGAALISARLGGTMAWTDAMILAATILAQFLLDNKKLENWIVWAVVNVFAIYTYATSGLPLVAFQYVFFLLNTVYGYLVWRRSKRATDILPTHAATGVPSEV